MLDALVQFRVCEQEEASCPGAIAIKEFVRIQHTMIGIWKAAISCQCLFLKLHNLECHHQWSINGVLHLKDLHLLRGLTTSVAAGSHKDRLLSLEEETNLVLQ